MKWCSVIFQAVTVFAKLDQSLQKNGCFCIMEYLPNFYVRKLSNLRPKQVHVEVTLYYFVS